MIEMRESTTAKLCSFARAYHSTYEKNKIFDDFLAFDFMGLKQFEETGQLIRYNYNVNEIDSNQTFHSREIADNLNRYWMPIPISRIAFAEQRLKAFADNYPICQYVVLGAGMDTFLFRNSNDNIHIFEIDHPDTQRFKRKRIKSLEWSIPVNAHLVPVDFEQDDMKEALLSAGFDPHIPSFFSVLGVTYYLPLNIFAKTVSDIASFRNADKELVFDFPDKNLRSDSKRGAVLTHITDMLGEPMTNGYKVSEVLEVLKTNGFSCNQHYTPEEIEKYYFSNRNDNLHAFENIHFISAAMSEDAIASINKNS